MSAGRMDALLSMPVGWEAATENWVRLVQSARQAAGRRMDALLSEPAWVNRIAWYGDTLNRGVPYPAP